MTVVPGHVRRARGLPPVVDSSISRRGDIGRLVLNVTRRSLHSDLVAIVIVVAATAATTVLEVMCTSPDVDVIFRWEAGARRGAVGRVTGRVRTFWRGEADASGTAGSARRGGHGRAVAAPAVQPNAVHVLRRRVHRVYLGTESRYWMNRVP